MTALASACRGEEQLRFRYADARANAEERRVEPHGLVHAGARWYLVAWDLERQDWRTFRVDRMLGKPALGKRFVPRKVPHGGVAAFVSRSISTGVYTYQARVLLDAPIERIAERLSPSAGRLERLDAEHCLLETGGHALDVLGLYIAMLGVSFRVLKPPELATELRALSERLANAARSA